MANASEAVALDVEGLREDGEPLESGVIAVRFPCRRGPVPAVSGERLIKALCKEGWEVVCQRGSRSA